MSLVATLLTPFALLLPAASAPDAKPVTKPIALEAPADAEAATRRAAPERPTMQVFESWPLQFIADSFRPESVFQVRIEQQVTIRVSPRARELQPNSLMSLPDRAIGPRFTERKIGKCLPVSRISGVQPDGASNLILFMRDRRMISARLERACRARDFYSGFYLARSGDGNLCVDRDSLQSRSGANCKVTRIRQLIELDD